MQKKLLCRKIERNALVHGFKTERIEPIPELHSTAYIFTHEKTGARLLHLYNDDPDNLFSIAFRTPVYDDTGVPHIMEHSVLSGSRKFPIKDPFQEMLKGSLQTFLNALTYRDKTVYPVASQVEKDFFNLVDVYCDAVFHPLLTKTTFYQEGWHFESEGPSKLIGIKGIVYNEMKGVFSDFASHVGRKTVAGLMPDTPYAFESGGEPEHITDLTYEAFIAFHGRYYHPSNAFIVLYGNIPSEKTLEFLDSRYLAEFDAIAPASEIPAQSLWSAPVKRSFEAPAPKEDDGSATVLLAWIFGPSVDPVSILTGTVLSHYLLGAESSPLKRALIDSGLGEDLDDISGFGIEAIQSTFAAGLRKTKPEHAEKIEGIILAVLRAQVEEGMDAELLEGALRQIEFHLREVNGGHVPYHLRLADRCYNAWLYGGDPLAHLAFEKPLAIIKEHLITGGDAYFRDSVKRHLLDNRHRLLAVIAASSRMGAELGKQTEIQAAGLSASFTEDDKRRYAELTRELVARQNTPPSPEALATLPRLTKNDLPAKGFETPAVVSDIEGRPFYQHPIFTSDIVYFDIGFDLRGIPADLLPYLPLYLELLHRSGTASCSYERMATRIALSTGGVGTSVSCRTAVGADDDLVFYSFLHGKSLRSRFDEMLAIIQELLVEADPANLKQIKDILLEARNGLNASIINNGHHVALLRASSHLSQSRYVQEQLDGISQLRFLEKLIRDNAVERIAPHLRRLHALTVNKNACVISVTADDPEPLTGRIASLLNNLPAAPLSLYRFTPPPGPDRPSGIEINSAVNFTARAWRIDAFDPEEYGLLFLMARHLSTDYLWNKIRVEGGAYGGMSTISAAHPVFACMSYRDPNLGSTLGHFERGIEDIVAGVKSSSLETSIIGAIGRIDQPKAPHERGLGETLDRLFGYTPQKRQLVREAVLGATPEKLQSIARKLLERKKSAIAVLANAATFDAAAREGWSFEREPLLRQ